MTSVIDKERIRRLRDNNYLDNLYRSAFIGMIANVITIITAFLLVFLKIKDKEDVVNIFIYVEVTSFIVGLVFLIWCIKELQFVILKLK